MTGSNAIKPSNAQIASNGRFIISRLRLPSPPIRGPSCPDQTLSLPTPWPSGPSPAKLAFARRLPVHLQKPQDLLVVPRSHTALARSSQQANQGSYSVPVVPLRCNRRTCWGCPIIKRGNVIQNLHAKICGPHQSSQFCFLTGSWKTTLLSPSRSARACNADFNLPLPISTSFISSRPRFLSSAAASRTASSPLATPCVPAKQPSGLTTQHSRVAMVWRLQ